MGYLACLQRQIAKLRHDREMRLISDDFAMTNGTIREFDRQISHLQGLLDEARQRNQEEVA